MSSGVKHDQGKVPMDLLSTKALREVARVMDFGRTKYDAHNWRGGIAWSRVISAALRHLTSFNDGEDKDPETGISHLAHAACCLMFLLEYETTHRELDDRFKLTAELNESPMCKCPPGFTLHKAPYEDAVRCDNCGLVVFK